MGALDSGTAFTGTSSCERRVEALDSGTAFTGCYTLSDSIGKVIASPAEGYRVARSNQGCG